MPAAHYLLGFLPLLTAPAPGQQEPARADVRFTDTFDVATAELAATGENAYFVLVPGAFVVLEGKSGADQDKLEVTVLDETKLADGVEARVVEHKRSKNGALVALTRYCLAISKRTESVYCLGAEVAAYEDGKVGSRAGSWRAGDRRARPGLFLPGIALLGARWQQGKVLGVAVGRDEITSVSKRVDTPAGTFVRCLEIEETTAASPMEKHRRSYAPGIGLVQDGDLLLTKHGRGGPAVAAAAAGTKAPAAFYPPTAAVAVDAVSQRHPRATVFAVMRGGGTAGVVSEPYWVVQTAEGHGEGEHHVTSEGLILRSRLSASSQDAPPAVAEALAKLCDAKALRSFEREEIGAVLRYVPLLEPMVTWVATVSEDGKTRTVTQAAGTDAPHLGPAPTGVRKENDEAKQKAFAAVKALRPDATLDGYELVGYSDGSGGMEVLAYEVEFHSGGEKHEWQATSEGALVEHSDPCALADVPEPVLAELRKAAKGGKIESVQRRCVQALLRFAPCPDERLVWIAKWTKGGKAESARLASDGRVLPGAAKASGK